MKQIQGNRHCLEIVIKLLMNPLQDIKFFPDEFEIEVTIDLSCLYHSLNCIAIDTYLIPFKF